MNIPNSADALVHYIIYIYMNINTHLQLDRGLLLFTMTGIGWSPTCAA